MNKSHLPLFPKITRDKTNYVIHGMADHPITIWNIKSRLERAHQNIQNAKKLSEDTVPFFIGCEHLIFLKNEWPSHKPVVVIEKCNSYYQDFIKDFPHLKVNTSNVHVVLGQTGFPSFHKFNIFDQIFYFQEISYLTLKLSLLKDELFVKYTVFLPTESEFEKKFITYLLHGIHLVIQSKNYHSQNKNIYDEIINKPVKNKALVFHQEEDHISLSKKILGKVIPENLREECVLLDQSTPRNCMEIFSGVKFTREQIFSEGFIGFLNQFKTVADHLIEKFKNGKHMFAVFRNRFPIANIEDFLFTEEILRRLNIPLYLFYTDWFSQICNMFGGGWSFHIYHELFDAPQNKTFSMYGFHSSIYRLNDKDVYFFPYGYLDNQQKILPPVENQKDILRDVAIVHHCRGFTENEHIFNEVYQLIINFSEDDDYGKYFFRFLYRLRQTLSLQNIYSHALKQLINLIDFLYYSKSRVDRIRLLTQKLKHLKIEVFGKSWDKFIDPDICAKRDIDKKELLDVYRNSVVTVDFSPMFSINSPTPYISEILSVGGMPIHAYPTMNDKESVGHDFFNSENLIHFKNVDDLSEKIIFYKNNWEKRNAYITKAQKDWVSTLINQTPQSFENLFDKPIKRLDNFEISFHKNPHIENAIIKTALGYLYMISGYLHHTWSLWEEALDEPDFEYKPLVYRYVETCIQAKHFDRALKFLNRMLSTYPNDENLLKFKSHLS